MGHKIIQHFRKAKKLSQKQLAELSSLSLPTIQNIERGTGSQVSFNKILDALDIEIISKSNTNISELIRDSKVSYRQISKDTGLNIRTIKNIEQGKGNLKGLFDLYKYFKITIQFSRKQKSQFTQSKLLRSKTKIISELEGQLNLDQIYHGNCLDVMKHIQNESVDMILADLPFQCTKNYWDSEIDLDLLWKQYRRVIKENGCIALFAQSPFDKKLAMSAHDLFKYEWIVVRPRAGAFLNASRRPLQKHDTVLIFYKKQSTYNPQKSKGLPYKNDFSVHSTTSYSSVENIERINTGDRHPTTILDGFTWGDETHYHPTQKMVSLLEFLIKTYTNEGDLVLDNTCGSGSTLVAAKNTNRHFIGIEKESEYCEISKARLSQS